MPTKLKTETESQLDQTETKARREERKGEKKGKRRIAIAANRSWGTSHWRPGDGNGARRLCRRSVGRWPSVTYAARASYFLGVGCVGGGRRRQGGDAIYSWVARCGKGQGRRRTGGGSAVGVPLPRPRARGRTGEGRFAVAARRGRVGEEGDLAARAVRAFWDRFALTRSWGGEKGPGRPRRRWVGWPAADCLRLRAAARAYRRAGGQRAGWWPSASGCALIWTVCLGLALVGPIHD